MSYYTHAGNEATDFDEYDPTPYGRGYDIYLTFGRPLDPSNETCYLNSSPSDDFDYKRPQFSSYSEPSAYAARLLKTSTHTTPDQHTNPDQLSGSILVGDIQRESTKADLRRPMGSSLVGRRDSSSDSRGLNRVMVGSPNIDTPVRNMDLGINEGSKLMSLTPNILGTVGSQSTRCPNRSMDPISE
ncbi:hypothetical protein ACFX2I_022877 [Malus domestica]